MVWLGKERVYTMKQVYSGRGGGGPDLQKISGKRRKIGSQQGLGSGTWGKACRPSTGDKLNYAAGGRDGVPSPPFVGEQSYYVQASSFLASCDSWSMEEGRLEETRPGQGWYWCRMPRWRLTRSHDGVHYHAQDHLTTALELTTSTHWPLYH